MSWPYGDPPENEGKKLLYNEPMSRPKRRERPRDRNRAQSQFQLSALQGLGPNDIVPRPRQAPVPRATPTPMLDAMYAETILPVDYSKVLLPKDQKRTIPACPPLSSIKGAKFVSKYSNPQQKILPRAPPAAPEVTKIIWAPSTEYRKPKLIEPNINALVDRRRGYRQDDTGASRDFLRPADPTPAPPLTAAEKYGYSPIGEPLATMRKLLQPTEEEPGPNAYLEEPNKDFTKRLLKRRKKNTSMMLSAEGTPPIASSPVTERPTSGRRSSPKAGSPLPGIDHHQKSKSPIEEDASKTETQGKKPSIVRKHTLAENKAWYAKFKASRSGAQ